MSLLNNSKNLKLYEEMEILKDNMKNNFNKKLKEKIEEKNVLIDSKKGLENNMKNLANFEKFDKRNVFLEKVKKIINKDRNLKNNICLKCLGKHRTEDCIYKGYLFLNLYCFYKI